MINEEVINDIKSEINEKIIVKNRAIRSVEAQERIRTAQQVLDIINKHTKSKGENMKAINIQDKIKKHGLEEEFKKTENVYDLYFKLTGLGCKDKRILKHDFDNVSIKDFCEIVNNMGYKVEINK